MARSSSSLRSNQRREVKQFGRLRASSLHVVLLVFVTFVGAQAPGGGGGHPSPPTSSPPTPPDPSSPPPYSPTFSPLTTAPPPPPPPPAVSNPRLPTAVVWLGPNATASDKFIVYLGAQLETRYMVLYADSDDDFTFNKTLVDAVFLPVPHLEAPNPYPADTASAGAFLEAGGVLAMVGRPTVASDSNRAVQYMYEVLTAQAPGTQHAWVRATNLSACTLPSPLTQANVASINSSGLPTTSESLSDAFANKKLPVNTPLTYPKSLQATIASRGVAPLGCAGAVPGFHALYAQVIDGTPLVEWAGRGNGLLFYLSYTWDDEGGNPKQGWGELAAWTVAQAYLRNASLSTAPSFPDYETGVQLGDLSNAAAQESFLPVSRGRPCVNSTGQLTGLSSLRSPVAHFNPVTKWTLDQACYELAGPDAPSSAPWIAFDLGLIRPVVRAAVQRLELGSLAVGASNRGLMPALRIEVRLSNSSFTGTADSGVSLCASTAAYLPPPPATSTSPPRVIRACPPNDTSPPLGRYVAIRLLDSGGWLTQRYPHARLCGVDVWASMRTPENVTVSLASRYQPVCLGVPPNAPPDFAITFASRPPDNSSGSLAVDGLYNDNRAGSGSGMCALSFPQDGHWFTVDLGQPQLVMWVELTKSVEPSYDQQLKGIYIVVHNKTYSNSSSADVGSCEFGSYNASHIYTLPTCGGVSEGSGHDGLKPLPGATMAVECSQSGHAGLWGQLVTVYRPPQSRTPGGYLGPMRICELDVYVAAPQYGLQQVSYNRPVDYGGPGSSSGVSLRPELTDVVNARTFRRLPEALLTDGDTVQDQKVPNADLYLCPRLVGNSTVTYHNAGDGLFLMVDLGESASGGWGAADGSRGYRVEAVVVTFGASLWADDPLKDQVAPSWNVYVGSIPAGSLYNATASGRENTPCAVHLGPLDGIDPWDSTWANSKTGTIRRRYSCSGAVGRYVVLLAVVPWQPSGSWESPSICEVEVYARVEDGVLSSLSLVTWRPTKASTQSNTTTGAAHLALRNPNTQTRRNVASTYQKAASTLVNETAVCTVANAKPTYNFWVLDLQNDTASVAFVRFLGSYSYPARVVVRVLTADWDSTTHPANATHGSFIPCRSTNSSLGGIEPLVVALAGGWGEAVCGNSSADAAVGRYVAIYRRDDVPLVLCSVYVYTVDMYDNGLYSSSLDSSTGLGDITGAAGLATLPSALQSDSGGSGTGSNLGGGVVAVLSRRTLVTGRVPESLATAPDDDSSSSSNSSSSDTSPPLVGGRRRQLVVPYDEQKLPDDKWFAVQHHPDGCQHQDDDKLEWQKQEGLRGDVRRRLLAGSEGTNGTSLWRFDMGQAQPVDQVVMVAYGASNNVTYVQYDDVQILTSNTSTLPPVGSLITSTATVNSMRQTVTSCGGIVGRYVFASRTTNSSLRLSYLGVTVLTDGSEGRVVSGRPTNQTGGAIVGPGGSGNAVNGYFSSAAVEAAGGSASGLYFGSFTPAVASPWWAVDMGVALQLSAVVLAAAAAEGGNSSGDLAGYELRLTNHTVKDGTEGVVLVANGPFISAGSTQRLAVPSSAPPGRLLIVRLPPREGVQGQVLALGQVEMLVNATMLNATQITSSKLSATLAYDSLLSTNTSSSWLAVDGLGPTSNGSSGCAVVNGSDSGGSAWSPVSWLTIGLGSSFEVGRIEVQGPLASSSPIASVMKLEVRLGDKKVAETGRGDENPVVLEAFDLQPGVLSIQYLPRNKQSLGQYLTLRTLEPGGPLILCEVTAFGPTPYDVITDLSPPPPFSRPPQSPPSPPKPPIRLLPPPPSISREDLQPPNPSSSQGTNLPPPFPLSPPRPPPPSPPSYQIGNLDSNSRAVQAVAASTVAATAAATVAASVASSMAAGASASAVGGAAGGAGGGGASGAAGSLSTSGAMAASIFMSHMQFFALTCHTAANTTEQFRQMNGNLTWLNLDFTTFSLRSVPRVEATAYNQIINSALLVAAVVAAHATVMALAARVSSLSSWSLPSWLVFPFPEIFAVAFSLSSLSASSALLLGSGVVGGRGLPAAVGAVTAAIIVAFTGFAIWLLYRIRRVGPSLAIAYIPGNRTHNPAGQTSAKPCPVETAGTVEGSDPRRAKRSGPLGESIERRISVTPSTSPPPTAGSGNSGRTVSISRPSEVLISGPFSMRAAAYSKRGMCGEGLPQQNEGEEEETEEGALAKAAAARKAAKKEREAEEEEEVQREIVARQRRVGFFNRMLLGRWNREEVWVLHRQLEPHRSRRYVAAGLSIPAAIRCLYPIDFAAQAAEEAAAARAARRRHSTHARQDVNTVATRISVIEPAAPTSIMPSSSDRITYGAEYTSVSSSGSAEEAAGAQAQHEGLAGRHNKFTAWAGSTTVEPSSRSTATTASWPALSPRVKNAPEPHSGGSTSRPPWRPAGASHGSLLTSTAAAAGGTAHAQGRGAASRLSMPAPPAPPAPPPAAPPPPLAPGSPILLGSDGAGSGALRTPSELVGREARLNHLEGVPPMTHKPSQPSGFHDVRGGVKTYPRVQPALVHEPPNRRRSDLGLTTSRPPHFNMAEDMTAPRLSSAVTNTSASSGRGGSSGTTTAVPRQSGWLYPVEAQTSQPSLPDMGKREAASASPWSSNVAVMAGTPAIAAAMTTGPKSTLPRSSGLATRTSTNAAEPGSTPQGSRGALQSPTPSAPRVANTNEAAVAAVSAAVMDAPGVPISQTPLSSAQSSLQGPLPTLPPGLPHMMALLSFGANQVNDMYVSGGGPRMLPPSGHNSHASLAPRPPSAGRKESGASEDDVDGGGLRDAGGRRFVHRKEQSGAGLSGAPSRLSAAAVVGGSMGGIPRAGTGGSADGRGGAENGGGGDGDADGGGGEDGGNDGGGGTKVGKPSSSSSSSSSSSPSSDEEDGDRRPNEHDSLASIHDQDNTSDPGAADAAVLDAGIRLLLTRTEVYERYGLTFEENQGHRGLASTFYIAFLSNSILSAVLLGLQSGANFTSGSSVTVAANVALLVVKAAYTLYLSAVLPYVNVVLVGAEVASAWLEIGVVVCMVVIAAVGGNSLDVLTSDVGTTSVEAAAAAAGNSKSGTNIKAAGDAMMVFELLVFAVQITSMFLTAVIPAVIAIVIAVRVRKAHKQKIRQHLKEAKEAREIVALPGYGAVAMVQEKLEKLAR